MATRDLADLGINLQKIITRLMSNQTLVKLLYYTDKDPLAKQDLTNEQIKTEVYNKLIKIIPKVSTEETAQSRIALRVVGGSSNMGNNEFQDFKIGIEVFVPMTQWMIKDSNLRPFAIMGEIHKSLKGKKVEGLGTINGGDFNLNFLTEEMSCYEMIYYFTSYD